MTDERESALQYRHIRERFCIDLGVVIGIVIGVGATLWLGWGAALLVAGLAFAMALGRMTYCLWRFWRDYYAKDQDERSAT